MINTGELATCQTCKTRIRADLFNAFFRPVAPDSSPGYIQEQGQAECYNHPGRPAKVPCDQCGRLLCKLCEVELDGRILCLGCIKTGRQTQQISRLDTSRTHFDSLALALALGPIIFIFPTILTAPAALYVALRYWKRPPTILPRSRWRDILAILLALAQMAGWIVFFVKFFG